MVSNFSQHPNKRCTAQGFSSSTSAGGNFEARRRERNQHVGRIQKKPYHVMNRHVRPSTRPRVHVNDVHEHCQQLDPSFGLAHHPHVPLPTAMNSLPSSHTDNALNSPDMNHPSFVQQLLPQSGEAPHSVQTLALQAFMLGLYCALNHKNHPIGRQLLLKYHPMLRMSNSTCRDGTLSFLNTPNNTIVEEGPSSTNHSPHQHVQRSEASQSLTLEAGSVCSKTRPIRTSVSIKELLNE
ncbi:hypothetical protein C9374_006026 [Naegleria lovaniensis]|uniref:Uncharacterized protein n=1 Tax=Naegleria lovaniensis TaxID=51637 RepID=A0AA88GNN6_NAELO|nr:uncharacterized protein C9374_006026 [Naegleria lovaniensis]KAG2381642.1 hypothetical protein C9374_006026 [Naegleria lovaniensis]